jgi:hypothetical protein
MKKLFVILIFCVAGASLSAQDYSVPKGVKYSKGADYATYEPEVLKTIDWWMNTPVNVSPEKRREANDFLILWLTGSPDISVEVNTDIVTFLKPNVELMLAFMWGWTKYAIETKDKSEVASNIKGIEAAIDFYNRNKDLLQKDKAIEKYIKMKDSGKLEGYITKKLQ